MPSWQKSILRSPIELLHTSNWLRGEDFENVMILCKSYFGLVRWEEGPSFSDGFRKDGKSFCSNSVRAISLVLVVDIL
jgi:hypothetical protein